ncbi:transposase [Pontiella sulfatireligans]|uniref:transposase n=1 Tax=Pontiella sulfatireligans TaxID=2750658 RepID=UPI00144397B4|nr:transposase [Pontiella sulfatireligans]
MGVNQYNPELHHRRSIRLKGHDYAGGGVYFVTLCAHREAGNIFATEMAKQIVAERLRITEEKVPDARWKEWVIMPDHFHALIQMDGGGLRLGDIIGGFKSAVSRELRRAASGASGTEKEAKGATRMSPVRRGEVGLASFSGRIWHRNYYEMIVRSAEAEQKIAEYIRMNPWKCVQSFSNGLRGMGNPALWNAEKLGVLCSRNAPRIGRMPEAAVYFGGWHSPKEKEMFDWLLEQKKRVIACPAWGIEGAASMPSVLEALEQNRLLILEMRNKDGDLAAAEQRNRFVIEHADEIFVPHTTPGGMLERLLKECRK